VFDSVLKERVEETLGAFVKNWTEFLKRMSLTSNFLSKHNEEKWYPSGLDKWKNDREPLIEYLEDRLDECRRSFMCLQEKLWDCHSIARGDDEEL
jgi:hypothetical protein